MFEINFYILYVKIKNINIYIRAYIFINVYIYMNAFIEIKYIISKRNKLPKQIKINFFCSKCYPKQKKKVLTNFQIII